jgi:L-ascorbate 6-phosphate lactonase
LKAAPKNIDVLLTCINGKWGNLNLNEAIKLTQAVEPRYVIPNHYDIMALNSENPESFKVFCKFAGVKSEVVILEAMEEFIW